MQPPESRRQAARYFEAARAGDEWGTEDALNKVVEINRGVHNASGVEAWAHLPLPSTFASELVQHLDALPSEERQPALDALLTKFEPSVRTLARQQLSQVAKEEARVFDDAFEAARQPRPPLISGRSSLSEEGECVNCSGKKSTGHVLTGLQDAFTRRRAAHTGTGSMLPLSLREEHAPADPQREREDDPGPSDLPPADPNRALRKDPPISFPKPYAEPPLVLGSVNGQV